MFSFTRMKLTSCESILIYVSNDISVLGRQLNVRSGLTQIPVLSSYLTRALLARHIITQIALLY